MTSAPAEPLLRRRATGFVGFAGVSRRDITPPVGIRNRNWGPATKDTATGVHRPMVLTALALATSQTATPIVLIAVDGTWWRQVADWRQIQQYLLDQLGLPAENVLLNLSHTHAGAVLCAAEQSLPGGEFIPAYLDEFARAAAAAAEEAVGALAPATVEWAVGHSTVATNRELDLDGRALVGFNPAAEGSDDTVLVGRVCQSTNIVATIVNYACHPTTLAWENEHLSPDYVGALRETVETETGGLCLFLQGASGDLAPLEQYTGDASVADRHGRVIGLAALAALAEMPPAQTTYGLVNVVESGAPLAVWAPVKAELDTTLAAVQSDTELPLRPLPTLEQLAQQWADINPTSRDERLRRARQLRENYIDLENKPDTVTHPLWALRIGGALLAAHPGEAYSWFQQELRRRFPDTPVAVLNLTNGPGFVYIPDSAAYRRNAYQAWQTPLAEGALERFTDAATQVLATLQDPAD